MKYQLELILERISRVAFVQKKVFFGEGIDFDLIELNFDIDSVWEIK